MAILGVIGVLDGSRIFDWGGPSIDKARVHGLCMVQCPLKSWANTVGSKIHASGYEGGWYLLSGLGHKITIESLLKVKVARTRT